MAKRQTQYMVLGGVAIAAVLFVSGFYSNTYFSSESNNQQFESINLGAFVTVDVYDSDGTLYHSWEGHNALLELSKHRVAICHSGFFENQLSPFCTGNSMSTMQFTDADPQTWGIAEQTTTITYLPETCNPNVGNTAPCTSWEVEGTAELFSDCSGEPCSLEVINVGSFSSVIVDPPIEMSPGDRVIGKFTYSFG